MDNALARLAYLDAAEQLLWPPRPAEDSRSVVASEPSYGLRILPGHGTPRILAPATPRRAASAAVMRYAAQQGWLGRSAGVGLAVAIALGWPTPPSARRAAHAVGSETIDAHLSDVLGEPVETSLALSRDRANRKPVLQVFDRRGRTIAFVKIGVNDLTTRLVDNEAAALRDLASRDLHTIEVPAVVDYRSWRGMQVLVMSALPAMSVHRRNYKDSLQRAMIEVAAVSDRPAPDYVTSLRQRADDAIAVAGEALVRPWQSFLDAVVLDPAIDDIAWGTWHGDWTSWNCVVRGSGTTVWDWERYSSGVPVGFDRLHFEINQAVGRSRTGFATAAPALLGQAFELLAPWNVSRPTARVVALLYILDISLRYMADDQRATGGGGGSVEDWAFPTLSRALPNAGPPTIEGRT